MARIDLTGQRFGRLTAEEPAPPRVLLSGKHTALDTLRARRVA